MKASIRREGLQRRMKERASQRGLNTNYLEGDDDDDDDNVISVSAIKKQFKKGAKREYSIF